MRSKEFKRNLEGHLVICSDVYSILDCFLFSKSNSAHSTKMHLAQLDSTAAAIGATPNLMAETESTRDFGLAKSLRGATEFKITSLVVQSTS